MDTPNANNFIVVKITREAFVNTSFRVRKVTYKYCTTPKTPLAAVKIAFRKDTGLPPDFDRFFFDGDRVKDDHTAATLGMISGDIIEVYEEQIGGSEEIPIQSEHLFT